MAVQMAFISTKLSAKVHIPENFRAQQDLDKLLFLLQDKLK